MAPTLTRPAAARVIVSHEADPVGGGFRAAANAFTAPSRTGDVLPIPTPAALNAGAGRAEPAAFGAARTDLLRHLRRIWMGAALRRAPHSIIAARLSAEADAAQADLAPTLGALRTTLAEIGTVYDVGTLTLAVVMPNVALHQAQKIAQAILAAIEQRGLQLRLSAAVVALHRDDDPVTAVRLAEICLGIALAAPGATAVCETDPGIRLHAR